MMDIRSEIVAELSRGPASVMDLAGRMTHRPVAAIDCALRAMARDGWVARDRALWALRASAGDETVNAVRRWVRRAPASVRPHLARMLAVYQQSIPVHDEALPSMLDRQAS